ncbi:GRP family sugar transporter [Domibacillus iocasae]|uniref:Glucose transporter GlcU n=1 Tax=Domibacillus iocasae TaxID=1714016 RepID=A0A1E7DRH9_9BACI|nr:GRP family sugar transporter [Domibacillus iocasae]OES45674.1 glucose transporter GlcU [Domibacillus iocasae]
MTTILIALIPAIAWGSIVLVSVKLGGDSYSQTLGITIGALIFAAGVYVWTHPFINTTAWIAGIISGLFWAVGQQNQLGSVPYLGVSKTVPISTGMQLAATTLFGVIVFKEWTTATAILLGSVSIILIIVGVILTSVTGGEVNKDSRSVKRRKGIMLLLFSTAGYLGYVVIIRWFNIDGWTAILPQAIGMFGGAIILTFKHKPFNKYAVRNILSGLIWGIGNLGLLLSLPRIGVATSFSLSQTGIVISTFGGIFLLGEKKTKKQLLFVVIGSILIIAGGVMIGFTKK